MPSYKNSPPHLRRRVLTIVTVAGFLVVLAGFANVLLVHGNTLTIVDPVVRWVWPNANASDIGTIHNLGREVGHFLIPAIAFALLMIGPLRKRPLLALALCAGFAIIDEGLQLITPGRSGTLEDVFIDTAGAALAYLVYLVFPGRSSRTN